LAKIAQIAGAVIHCGKTPHIETGAERPALTRQNHRAQAFFSPEPLGCIDQRIEHRRIQRIHLVHADHPDVGDPSDIETVMRSLAAVMAFSLVFDLFSLQG
jgi:hypothetical protein